jgi:Concanavalin A-like lectin/glucanases superfamily/Secretion system C-terminal sorting domain
LIATFSYCAAFVITAFLQYQKSLTIITVMKKYLLLLLLIVLVVLQKANAQTPVAYYPFNGNANDAAGTNNGTANGATLTTDRFGNANSAYSFDGVDDNITYTQPWTNVTDNFTMSVWLKPNVLGGCILTNGQNSFPAASPYNGYSIKFGARPAGDMNGVASFNGGVDVLSTGLWFHIVLVRESGTSKLYVNGVLQPTTLASAPNTPAVSAIIGSLNSGTDFVNGSIDEVKIYNTALTATQVQAEYNPNTYSSQFNNSVKMNGANDQIELGSTYTQQIFTVEMWVKPGATQVQYANIIDNNHTGSQNWVCQQDFTNTNQYGFGVNPSSGVTFSLLANQWQHLALIKSATAVEVYVNGILVQSAPLIGSINVTGHFLRLGNWGGGGRNWNGTMDDVRYWNTARTQAQIVANMNTQLTGNEAGLVGYWDMNRSGQGAGLTVDNKCVATGAVLNGTTVGTASTPIFAPGVTQQKPGSGNAISFDGVDDVVVNPNSSAINFGTNNDFTIDFWIKLPTNQTNLILEDNMIIDKWIPSVPDPYPFSIRYCNSTHPSLNGQIQFNRYDGTNISSIASGSNFNDNKWHFVTCVKSGGNLLIYKDGILANTGTDIVIGSTTNNYNLHFGARGTTANFLNGSLDEVRIWNTTLTPAQIRDRMCRKITSTDALYPNLVAYYNFDEGTGTTVFDATANNNNGALTNSPTRITSGAPIGNASSHDYVNATKTTSLTHPTGESFTVTSASGNPNGIQVYRVDEQPNTLTGATGVGTNNKYFGVFQAGGSSPQYTAVYNYNGNPGVTPANENQLRLNKRTDNSVTSWTTMTDISNEPANTITITGESTEYILGKLGAPLPLNLISFTGSKKDKDALLQWKTANEINVSRFEVQRSTNGQIFETIGTVAAGGSLYSFTDANTFISRIVAFYRLKLIDVDGRFTFSNIIKLNKQASAALTVYPNPVGDVLTINVLKQNGILLLYNAEGKLLQQQTVTTQTITMDVSKYAKGIYLLQYKTEDEVVNQKIIKQ